MNNFFGAGPMKNEEFNAEQMLILLQLVRVAKDEVHEALEVEKILLQKKNKL